MRPQQNYGGGSVTPQQDSRADLMRKAKQASADCNRRNRETASGKMVESNILIFSETQPNKFDLMSSRARLSDGQKKALKQFLAETMSCRNIMLEGYKGTVYQDVLQKDYGSKDIVYGKLLAGQMTIGDANTAIKQINLKTVEDTKAANPQASAPLARQQVSSGPGNVMGQTFDSEANGNIFLYDGPCKLNNYRNSYPFQWDAKRADNGAFIGEGCYSVNQQTQQVFLMGSTGKAASLPLSTFQGGGNKSWFQSVGEGVQRAAKYLNDSAAQTQRNTTNLTPGLTGGNQMNCVSDGRGGYNCR